jgi:WXG100 family type VII secretion target
LVHVVVTPEIAAAPARLHSDSATFGGIVSRLRSEVEALQSSWKGDAAREQYNYYTTEWDTAATALFGGNGQIGVLDEIGNTLAIVAGNYGEVEDTNRQGWRHR